MMKRGFVFSIKKNVIPKFSECLGSVRSPVIIYSMHYLWMMGMNMLVVEGQLLVGQKPYVDCRGEVR